MVRVSGHQADPTQCCWALLGPTEWFSVAWSPAPARGFPEPPESRLLSSVIAVKPTPFQDSIVAVHPATPQHAPPGQARGQILGHDPSRDDPLLPHVSRVSRVPTAELSLGCRDEAVTSCPPPPPQVAVSQQRTCPRLRVHPGLSGRHPSS